MECNLKVDQLVVVFKYAEASDPTARLFPGEVFPVMGVVYSVRDVFVGRMASGGDIVGIRLHEIRNPPVRDGREVGWPASYFRPVQSTDISVFNEMLKNVDDLETIEWNR